MSEITRPYVAEASQAFAPYANAEFVDYARLSEDRIVGIYRVDNGSPEGEEVLVRLPNDFGRTFVDNSNEDAITLQAQVRLSLSEMKERARLIARDIFMVPDGEDGIQMALALPYDVLELAQNAKAALKTVAESYSEQINVPISARQFATITVAAGLLIGTVSIDNSNNSKVDLDTEFSQESEVLDDMKVSYTDSSTIITLPALMHDNQDARISSVDAAKASGLSVDQVTVDEDRLILPRDIQESEIISAAISAAAPDVNRSMSTTTGLPSTTEVPKSVETMSDSEFIDWLAGEVKVTAADYETFDVDTSRVGVFSDEMTGNSIKPTAFVGHWTAGTYANGVDQFVSAIKNREGNCCSVMYFMDRDAKVYRFTASWEQTAHAKGANDYSQGVEIEARDLRDYTPEQMAAFVKLGYRFMTANNIPLERKNFIGHMELGTGKIDMPPELVDKLFVKLQELDKDIKNSSSAEVPTGSGEKSYDEAVSELLAEIRQHEGDFDAINRGEAGDTVTGSSEYIQALGGRKLTELTIQEILDLQSADKIMAVGGYQFIPGTFRSAVKATGIDVTRRFDEATQNEMAVDYLLMGGKRKTLTAYLKGESDDIDGAANDMCMEWASIPCADGKIYPPYNISGNAAKGGIEKHQKIRQMLINIRTARDQKDNPSPTPEVPNINNKVVLIGDSLTVGYNRFGKISEVDEYAGLDIIVSDGVGGRPLVGEDNPDDGVNTIERHIDEIAQAGSVIIGLGTNAPEEDETYKSEMEKVVARIHSPEVNPSANILLISGYSYADGTKSAERRDRRAVMLDEIADKYPNVYVLDVSNVITSDSFAEDGVHLTGEGYKKVTAEILKRTAEVLNTNAAQIPPAGLSTTTVATNDSSSSVADETLPTVPANDLSWFNEEQTRHIYEPYFRTADGSIDVNKLDVWMLSLLKAKDDSGNLKYQVTINNTPNVSLGE